MGIEKLRSSLLQEANAEASQIVSLAQTEAKAILDQDKKRSEEAKKIVESELQKNLSIQKEERTTATRLESKRLIAEAKEDVLNSVFDEFFDTLKELRKSPEYKKFLNNSLTSASAMIPGNIMAHVCKGDKELLVKNKNVQVIEDLIGIGGILIENSEGKIRVNYTLETLFEKNKDELRKKIFDQLFGGKK